jgi:hypothetical protein
MGQKLWPGFRVVKLKRVNKEYILKVEILEPAYYWRIQRDYDDAPEPTVMSFNPDKESMSRIRDRIDEMKHVPRLVLHGFSGWQPDPHLQTKVSRWANDSVGLYELPYIDEVQSPAYIHVYAQI